MDMSQQLQEKQHYSVDKDEVSDYKSSGRAIQRNTDAAIYTKQALLRNKEREVAYMKKEVKLDVFDINVMNEEEKTLRKKLSLCLRSLFKVGIWEGTDTHVTVALDSLDAFLVLPYGILWSNATPKDLVLVGFDGQILRESGRINPMTGLPHGIEVTALKLHQPMHTLIGKVRCKAIFHTHQRHATTLACSNQELQMIHQNSCRFFKSVIYENIFTGLADGYEYGIHMSKCFLKKENQNKRVLLQKHHGVFIIGRSLDIAFDDTYWLEKACLIQLDLMKAGVNPSECAMPDKVAQVTSLGQFYDTHDWYADSLVNAFTQAEILEQKPLDLSLDNYNNVISGDKIDRIEKVIEV